MTNEKKKVSSLGYKPKYYDFHKDISVNFQLNRLKAYSNCDTQELYEIAGKIKTYSDVSPVLISYYKKALSEKRMVDALYYLRVVEFFYFPDGKEKTKLYYEFRELFYKVYKNDHIIEHKVPYKNGALTAIDCHPKTSKIKDTIVLHGGGDSFMEEFYPSAKFFVDQGYRVILFEGPGQGYPLHKYNLKMTYKWENPTSAILDYFNLDDVTLIGISLGGYFALRAAAYEKRIKRVVLWDVVYDFFECVFGRNGRLKFSIINLLVNLNAKKTLNSIAKKQNDKIPEMKWIHEHLSYIYGVDSTYDFMKTVKNYTTTKISKMVTQDVFVLAGTDDHIIPFKMYKKQMKALKNTKSLKGRVYTKEEHAASHGQIGNIWLVIDEICSWLDSIKNNRRIK